MKENANLPGLTDEQNRIFDLVLDKYSLKLEAHLKDAVKDLEDKLWIKLDEQDKELGQLDTTIKVLDQYVKIKSGIWALAGSLMSAIGLLIWSLVKSGG